MINQSIWAHRCAHITFCHSEAWWTGWVPLSFTLLTVPALLRLAVATPERERLLTAKRSLFEELRAAVIIFIFLITGDIGGFVWRFIIGYIFMEGSAAPATPAFLASLSLTPTTTLLR